MPCMHMFVEEWMYKWVSERYENVLDGTLEHKKREDVYSAIKNEVLLHTTTCMNLENIMLRERNHSQKPTYCMIPFIWNV